MVSAIKLAINTLCQVLVLMLEQLAYHWQS